MIRTKLSKAVATIAVAALAATVATPAVAMAGTVRLSGSTTVFPLAQSWAKAYHAAHPETSFSVNGGGSGTGFKDAAKGTTIGMSSREAGASDSNSAAGGAPVMTAVARDAVAVIVNPKNNVRSLTRAQVQGIFTGQIKTWKEVGGNNKRWNKFNNKHAIVLAGRTGASGTYEFFKERFLLGSTQSGRTKMYASNGMVRAAVARDPYAIGYVSMSFINRSVIGVRVDRVYPNKANALSKTYPYVRDLYFINYPNFPISGEAQSFINYCLSAAGQAIAAKEYLALH